jgi:hypothetical protein
MIKTKVDHMPKDRAMRAERRGDHRKDCLTAPMFRGDLMGRSLDLLPSTLPVLLNVFADLEHELGMLAAWR